MSTGVLALFSSILNLIMKDTKWLLEELKRER